MNISNKIICHYPIKPSYLLATTPSTPDNRGTHSKEKRSLQISPKNTYSLRKMGKGRGGEEKKAGGKGVGKHDFTWGWIKSKIQTS